MVVVPYFLGWVLLPSSNWSKRWEIVDFQWRNRCWHCPDSIFELLFVLRRLVTTFWSKFVKLFSSNLTVATTTWCCWCDNTNRSNRFCLWKRNKFLRKETGQPLLQLVSSPKTKVRLNASIFFIIYYCL